MAANTATNTTLGLGYDNTSSCIDHSYGSLTTRLTTEKKHTIIDNNPVTFETSGDRFMWLDGCISEPSGCCGQNGKDRRGLMVMPPRLAICSKQEWRFRTRLDEAAIIWNTFGFSTPLTALRTVGETVRVRTEETNSNETDKQGTLKIWEIPAPPPKPPWPPPMASSCSGK